ncbi:MULTISPECIES: helix-turn-helix domain-containing protein [unclassified Bradyrhizobium]|uniref:helix-turn-helix domain-containing protein n=1 Tax=unclassified Bradyrhizobium TaxID=2631580 RepID=UPI0035C6B4B6
MAARLGVGPHTIGKWRKRFITDRIEGLYDEMRSGRPRTVEDEAVASLASPRPQHTGACARSPKRYASGQHPGQSRRSAAAFRQQPLWTVGSPSNSTGAGRRLC